MTFTLSDEQWKKLAAWEAEQDAAWVAEHGSKDGQPYYGAIGGSLTFSFTPTGLGTVVKAKHANGQEIDLTDYDMW